MNANAVGKIFFVKVILFYIIQYEPCNAPVFKNNISFYQVESSLCFYEVYRRVSEMSLNVWIYINTYIIMMEPRKE